MSSPANGPSTVLEHIDSEEEDRDSVPTEYNIATFPADYTLQLLHHKWKDGEIEVPAFQRNFVWKQPQASRLIESFLVGLPVPAVFLYDQRPARKYLVIDGQQRLRSVFQYFDGWFGTAEIGKRPVFRLKGLNRGSAFAGRSFDDLNEGDQRTLKNAILRVFIVRQLAPDNDSSMYHIFERLNTGGTLLSNQEIRNCVCHGRFAECLVTMNGAGDWRRIFGRAEPDARRRDVELILRFLALQAATYSKPMKDFLTRYMRGHKNASDDKLESFCKLFDSTCRAVVAALGDRPFHVRAGLNAAVFDAVMSAFAKHPDQAPSDVVNRYRALIADEEFDRYTRSGTTDVEVVKRRLELADKRLFRVGM